MNNLACDISVIIPVHNEEANIPELFRQITTVLESTRKSYEIIFIDDGSRDQSFEVIRGIHARHPRKVKAIQFSRNFGHQIAISCGFAHCLGRAAVVLDADLQDPPALIAEFIRKWEEGCEIVYGLRREREGETFFKKFTARMFYKMIRATTAIDIPENVGDFYLLDRKVVNIINALRERHRFMRGLVAWVGFRRCGIPYVRKARHSGATKYSFWKMVKFSVDAMTSFSFAPLRVVSWLGALFSVVAFFSILVIIYMRLFTDATIIGWSSTIAVILFIGGIQLLATGVIGEYIARIGDDVKSRPLYAVNQILE